MSKTKSRPRAAAEIPRAEDPDVVRHMPTITRPPASGDLVVIDGPQLAQVVHADGAAVIVAPLMDCRNGIALDPSQRHATQATDCSIVPTLLMPAEVRSEAHEVKPEISRKAAIDALRRRAHDRLALCSLIAHEWADAIDEHIKNSGDWETPSQIEIELADAGWDLAEHLDKLSAHVNFLARFENTTALKAIASMPLPELPKGGAR